jgi:diguanylate cyclase (GGDEF)-like protein
LGPLASFISVAQFAQCVGALLLSAILWNFHLHYRRGYLRRWGVSWLFFAVQMGLGGVAILHIRTPPAQPIRVALAAGASLAAYLHTAWLLAGAWELARGRSVPRRVLAWVAAAAAVLALGTTLAYVQAPDGAGMRYLLRVGVRALLAGLAFWAAGVAVWSSAGDRTSTGRGLLTLGLALFGAQQLHYFGLAAHALRTGGYAPYAPYMGVLDFLLQWVIGLGMVTCLLEEERAGALGSAGRAEHLAHHDALTGLPNRRLLLDRLAVMLAHAARTGERVGVLFLDLDRFKVINDSLGHSAGDRLLVQAAARILAAVRAGDTVARIGGDEFVVLLPGLRDAVDARRVVHQVAEAIRAPLLSDGDELFITPSVGVAVAPDDGADPETLLKHADIAMYRAKDGGGDRFEFFTPAMTERARERLELETALRRALAGEQFRVYYQPVWDVAAGRVSAVEALVRWMHPQRGMMPPAAFLEVAEATGLIAAIDGWVLRSACRELRGWHDAGFAHLEVFVNLSARQFGRPELLGEVRAALAESGVPAHSLELEITEGVAMRDAAATEAVLRDLKALGVRISIDDFGTGYSSLGYLRRFPLDTLKVDRTFVSDADTDRGNATIASAIIAMAHQLGLRAIAEGVERPGQMDFLALQRCDAVQGFLFSPPVPAAEVEALLRRTSFLPAAGQVA